MKQKLLLLFIWGIIVCPIYALKLTFHYDTSALFFEKDTTKYGVFEKVVWTDAFNGAEEVGMPNLPVFYHSLKIADNIIIDSIKVTLAKGTSSILTYPLKPYQQPIPIGYQIDESQFFKNESAYLTNSVMPHNSLVNYRVDQARDGKFLSLQIVPFEYNPVTNAYTAYSVAEVEVFTREEENQSRATRIKRDIGIPYYEYVIITSSQLAPAFESFAQWKKAKGYDVGIVNISDILNNPNLIAGDTISNIIDNAGKLRQYLIYSYLTAQTKYVLFGGDDSVIPIRYAKAYYRYSKNNQYVIDTINIPSDFYYSELNGNWDSNHNGEYAEIGNVSGFVGDIIDYGSELYVGRLLCKNEDDVINWTKKVLRYEINPGNGDYSYLARALFSQSDHMQQSHQAESVQQKLQGHISCTIYNEDPSYNAPQPTFPFGTDIITSINNIHYGLLSNFNHGGPLSYGIATKGNGDYGHDVHHGISALDSYDLDDNLLYSNMPEENNGFDNLTNVVYPSIMYSTSCINMPFDQYHHPSGTYNLGSVFTSKSAGGGPAYLGNTREGFCSTSTYMFKYFLDSIYLNNNNHLGVAEAKSKIHNNFFEKFICHSHNLLGCPEMSLYTQIPYTFDNIIVNQTNNQIFVSTGTIDSVECRICMSGNINGIYRQFVYADRSNVVFDTIPDIYTLVVSMPNYIPYIWTNDTCFLQNQNILDSRIYNGCDTFFIGSDITSIQPYGDVTIESGGNVEINVGENVIIKNSFEVKHGGQLLIH